MKNRRSDTVFIFAFCMMLALPLISFNLLNDDISTAENRKRKGFPELTEEMTQKERKDELSLWFDDNIGMRDGLQSVYGLVSYGIFGVSSTDKVLKGKDDWLFHTQDIDHGMGKTLPNDWSLKKMAFVVDRADEYFKAKDIDLYYLFIPTKESVYTEMIDTSLSTGPTVQDAVVGHLLSETDANIIDLKPVMLGAKEDTQVYFKTDTHWNTDGAYIASCAVMDRLRADGIIDHICDPAPERKRQGTYSGDLSTMIIPYFGPAEAFYSYNWERHAEETEDAGYSALVGSIYEENRYHVTVGDEYIFKNRSEDANDIRLLIIGDSFFSKDYYAYEYFGENVRELYYIRAKGISDDLIEYVKPDVVIFESTEKYLDMILKNDRIIPENYNEEGK